MRLIKKSLCALLIFVLLFILCAALTLGIRSLRRSQLSAADKVTLSCNDDGIAAVIESILGE